MRATTASSIRAASAEWTEWAPGETPDETPEWSLPTSLWKTEGSAGEARLEVSLARDPGLAAGYELGDSVVAAGWVE